MADSSQISSWIQEAQTTLESMESGLSSLQERHEHALNEASSFESRIQVMTSHIEQQRAIVEQYERDYQEALALEAVSDGMPF